MDSNSQQSSEPKFLMLITQSKLSRLAKLCKQPNDEALLFKIRNTDKSKLGTDFVAIYVLTIGI